MAMATCRPRKDPIIWATVEIEALGCLCVAIESATRQVSTSRSAMSSVAVGVMRVAVNYGTRHSVAIWGVITMCAACASP